jgi:hypothetical protein
MQMSFLSSAISGVSNLAASGLSFLNTSKNRKLQKQFAKKGIQWKVQDARAAGVHPLFALGASTHSFSPVSVGEGVNALRSGGQDIGRAVDASSSKSARMEKLGLERAALENELLRSQIARNNSAQLAPPVPGNDRYLMQGQGNSPLVINRAMERTVSAPEAPHQEPGAVPDMGFVRTPTGLAPVPSTDAKERIEDNWLQELMWAYRNNILPSLWGSQYGSPPAASPGKGRVWIYSPFSQEYQSVPKGSFMDRMFRKAF